MIRILHIVSDINRGSGVMGVVMNLYRNIDREKIQFDFLNWSNANSNSTYEAEIKELGGNVYTIPTPGFTKESYRGIRNFFLNYGRNYKVLHLHEVYLCMYIYPFSRKYGIKHIIAHSHTTKYSDIQWKALRNRLLCLPLKCCTNLYFACSKAAGSFLYGKRYVQNGNVIIINNAIDCNKFRYNPEIGNEMRKELNLENKFIVGHVGRFNEQKNHEFLIEIFSKIVKKNSESILLLVGTGPLEDKIKEKVRNYKLTDRVLFMGQRNDVRDLFQMMDVFVLPSFFEGFPIVLVEAQTSGLQCFSSDAVTKEARITDNVSFLSLKTNADNWAEKIMMNFQDYVRQDNSKNVCNAGFNIKDETERLEKIYMNLT